MCSLVGTVFSYHIRMLLICPRYDGVFGLQSVKLQYFVLTKRCLVNNEGPNVPYSQSMAARVAAEVCVSLCLCACMSSLRLKRNVLSSIFSQVKVRFLFVGRRRKWLPTASNKLEHGLHVYIQSGPTQ